MFWHVFRPILIKQKNKDKGDRIPENYEFFLGNLFELAHSLASGTMETHCFVLGSNLLQDLFVGLFISNVDKYILEKSGSFFIDI